MRTAPLMLGCWLSFVGMCASPADDRAISVGKWDVVCVTVNGKEVDPEFVTLLHVDYRGDGSWSVLFKRIAVAEGTSTNDESESPRRFEMETLATEPSRSRKYSGIYRLEGDERHLCFVGAGMPRPDTFTSPRGSGRILVTLRRATDKF